MRATLYGLLLSGLFACSAPPPGEVILGAWKVDSAYHYYNGFDYWQYDEGRDWATYIFDEEREVKEIKFGTYRSYRYAFEGDTLWWTAPNGMPQGKYEILELNDKRMVLKKRKPPVMGGVEKQERFELRFFSRTADPGAGISPYQPGAPPE